MKIRPVGAKLFHAGRRTDMTKLIVVFRKFLRKRIIRNTKLSAQYATETTHTFRSQKIT
jgi:hypothetical protein